MGLLGAEKARQRDQHKRMLTEIQGLVIYECGVNLHHEGVKSLIDPNNYLDFRPRRPWWLSCRVSWPFCLLSNEWLKTS